MNNTLEILPVKIPKHKDKFKLPDELPKPPFLLTIQAPVRSGKSNLIMKNYLKKLSSLVQR